MSNEKHFASDRNEQDSAPERYYPAQWNITIKAHGTEFDQTCRTRIEDLLKTARKLGLRVERAALLVPISDLPRPSTRELHELKRRTEEISQSADDSLREPDKIAELRRLRRAASRRR